MRSGALALAALAGVALVSGPGGAGPVVAQVPPSCPPAVSLDNGGFEQPVVASGFTLLDQSLVPGWSTTASDGLIELWRAPNSSGSPAASGSQFAELNATQASTLY